MTDHARTWILTVRLPACVVNPGRYTARILKWLLRVWGVRCTAIDEPAEVRQLRARMEMLEAEVQDCRRIIASLAERCAGQSELLSQRAERRKEAS